MDASGEAEHTGDVQSTQHVRETSAGLERRRLVSCRLKELYTGAAQDLSLLSVSLIVLTFVVAIYGPGQQNKNTCWFRVVCLPQLAVKIRTPTHTSSLCNSASKRQTAFALLLALPFGKPELLLIVAGLASPVATAPFAKNVSRCPHAVALESFPYYLLLYPPNPAKTNVVLCRTVTTHNMTTRCISAMWAGVVTVETHLHGSRLGFVSATQATEQRKRWSWTH